jgi:NAD(P)-dependent dehydrogenase (short-subunit alcohol dehydrogenase family)
MVGLLDRKVTVITGAGSGMAKASVRIFVREGAKVVAGDISGAEKDTAVEVGQNVLPVHGDVSSEADVEAMMAAAIDEFGRSWHRTGPRLSTEQSSPSMAAGPLGWPEEGAEW